MTVAVIGDFSFYQVGLEFGISVAILAGGRPLLLNLGNSLHHTFRATQHPVEHHFLQQIPPSQDGLTNDPITAVIGDETAHQVASLWDILWVPTIGLSEYIPAAADHPRQPQRVCVFGPESCGKSTLTRQLAQSLDGFPVIEYARLFYEAVQREPLYNDLLLIGFGQAVVEDMCARTSVKLLVCDTDALSTVVWSSFLFGRVDNRLHNYALSRASQYTLYLLLDIDLPWVADGVRYLPEDRATFLAACRSILKVAAVPYRLVSGHQQARLEAALEGLHYHFKMKSAPSLGGRALE